MSDSAVLWIEIAKLVLEYIRTLIWPAVAIFIVLAYKNSIGDIVSRLKSADLPGGVKLALHEKIEEAQQLSTIVSSAPVSDDRRVEKPIAFTKANERMIELGLRASPSGLDMQFYRELAEKDPNISLAGLRIDLEIMVKNLAKGWGIDVNPNDSISKTIRKLSDNEAITQEQQKLLNIVIGMCNQAAHGIEVSESEANEIIDITSVLARQYIAWLSWGFSD